MNIHKSTRGVLHTGPKYVTILGVKYTITADEVEEMKSIYNVTGSVGKARDVVLVHTGRIPDDYDTKRHAWYPVASIVGHRTPSQK